MRTDNTTHINDEKPTISSLFHFATHINTLMIYFTFSLHYTQQHTDETIIYFTFSLRYSQQHIYWMRTDNATHNHKARQKRKDVFFEGTYCIFVYLSYNVSGVLRSIKMQKLANIASNIVSVISDPEDKDISISK